MSNLTGAPGERRGRSGNFLAERPGWAPLILLWCCAASVFAQTGEENLAFVEKSLAEKGIPYESGSFFDGEEGVLVSLAAGDGPDGEAGENAGDARHILVIPLSSPACVLETGVLFISLMRERGVSALAAFTGGGAGGKMEPGAALRDLAEGAGYPGEVFFCCLDLEGSPEKLLVCYRSGSYRAPLGFLKPLCETAALEGIPLDLQTSKEGDETLDYLWEMDINGIKLKGREAAEGGEPLSAEKLTRFLAALCGNPSLSAADPDRNYLAFQVPWIGKRTFFLSERTIVSLVLAAGAFFFALAAGTAAIIIGTGKGAIDAGRNGDMRGQG